MSNRWIVVADSPFLPATGGGEREHQGFVRVAHEAGWLALLVIPAAERIDLRPYAELVGDTPILVTPRRTSPLLLAHPRHPFVVASRPMPTWLTVAARSVAGEVTGVVTFSYKSRLIGQGLAAALGVPMVLRQHNREGDYHRALAAGLRGPRRAVMAWEAARITRDELELDRSPDVAAVADISADDARQRRAAGADRAFHVPPFAFDSSLADASESVPPAGDTRVVAERRVLFLGALDVATNTSALDWFIERVWPVVLERDPQLLLDVVGRAPTEHVRTMVGRTSQAVLHADVPEVRPYLQRACVAVNPAVTGSGVNIKLIDYLQAGLPVVSTTLATRGLALRPGVDLEVHDRPDEFAGAIVTLAVDPVRAGIVARSGRARINELLDPRRNLSRLAAGFDVGAALPEDL